VASGTNPALQFSNSSAVHDNLTGGQLIGNLTTFSGSGHDIQTSVTVGYFFRF
jgi:hypothetical protein